MSDERPVLPWLEPGSEASADVRAVLESARSDGLSSAQVDALANKLLALSAQATVVASSAPASSSAALSLGAKISVATLLLAVGAVSAWSARAKPASHEPARAAVAPIVRAAPAASASSPALAPALPSVPSAPSGTRAPRVAPVVTAASRVARRTVIASIAPQLSADADAAVTATENAESPADDAALLHRAAAALRNGATSEAIALVARHRQRFATSPLGEERERIEIEALVRDGQRERAARAAERFRQLFPGSAQQLRIDGLVAR